VSVRSIKDAKPPAWRIGIVESEKGVPKRGLANTLHVLSRHPAWQGVLAYDEFAEAVVKLKAPPTRSQDAGAARDAGEWTEQDSARTAAWFASEIGFEPTTMMVEQAVSAMAERTRIHPVRDYLRGLTWDGIERLDHVLSTYFGARDSAYARAVSCRWMISAVARVMEPGCQADCMLVLESPEQGIGKSTGLEALFSKSWFADTGIAVGEKDSYQALRRKWGYEFGELSSLKGREVERVKAFVSARVDTYRPSYGRRTRDFPRQTVFCGTTNDTEYLADRTGNRRFWPIRCGARVDVDGLRRDRDQLWAEAFARYQRSEPWHVDTPELRRLCEAEQRERETADPWIELVEEWLANPTVPVGKTERERLDLAGGLTTADVLLGALDFRRAEIRQDVTIRVGHVLRKLGWKPRQQRENGERVRRYFQEASQSAQTTALGDCDTRTAENALESTCVTDVTDALAHTHKNGIGRNRDQKEIDRDTCDTVTPDDVERDAIVSEGEG
jgi:putative DNA primase/helicase